MDTTALRAAYDHLLKVAGSPDFGRAADGGWDANHVLAHILSVDAGIAAVALQVISGSRAAYDNRTSLDLWNLDRIVGGYADRAALIDRVRAQGAVLCDIAARLTDAEAAVLVPALLLSNDVVAVDQPLPLGGLIDALATNHLPEHTQQLLELRAS